MHWVLWFVSEVLIHEIWTKLATVWTQKVKCCPEPSLGPTIHAFDLLYSCLAAFFFLWLPLGFLSKKGSCTRWNNSKHSPSVHKWTWHLLQMVMGRGIRVLVPRNFKQQYLQDLLRPSGWRFTKWFFWSNLRLPPGDWGVARVRVAVTLQSKVFFIISSCSWIMNSVRVASGSGW